MKVDVALLKAYYEELKRAAKALKLPSQIDLETLLTLPQVVLTDEVKNLESLSKRIQAEIKDLIGSTCKITLVEPKTIQRSEGKAKRVIDNRKI